MRRRHNVAVAWAADERTNQWRAGQILATQQPAAQQLVIVHAERPRVHGVPRGRLGGHCARHPSLVELAGKDVLAGRAADDEQVARTPHVDEVRVRNGKRDLPAQLPSEERDIEHSRGLRFCPYRKMKMPILQPQQPGEILARLCVSVPPQVECESGTIGEFDLHLEHWPDAELHPQISQIDDFHARIEARLGVVHELEAVVGGGSRTDGVAAADRDVWLYRRSRNVALYLGEDPHLDHARPDVPHFKGAHEAHFRNRDVHSHGTVARELKDDARVEILVDDRVYVGPAQAYIDTYIQITSQRERRVDYFGADIAASFDDFARGAQVEIVEQEIERVEIVRAGQRAARRVKRHRHTRTRRSGRCGRLGAGSPWGKLPRAPAHQAIGRLGAPSAPRKGDVDIEGPEDFLYGRGRELYSQPITIPLH